MKELIERSYQAIKKRGKINETTTEAEFLAKIKEEWNEAKFEWIHSNKESYIEEITDIATACFMQIKHLGFDPVEEFEKVVIKNETRND